MPNSVTINFATADALFDSEAAAALLKSMLGQFLTPVMLLVHKTYTRTIFG
jgi:hypothetical protein